MYDCFCSKSFCKRSKYLDHLKNHEKLGEISLTVFCNQKNCDFKESFADFYKLNVHLRRRHDSEDNSKKDCLLLSRNNHLLKSKLVENNSMDFSDTNFNKPIELLIDGNIQFLAQFSLVNSTCSIERHNELK